MEQSVHRPLSQSVFWLDRRVNSAIRERGLRRSATRNYSAPVVTDCSIDPSTVPPAAHRTRLTLPCGLLGLPCGLLGLVHALARLHAPLRPSGASLRPSGPRSRARCGSPPCPSSARPRAAPRAPQRACRPCSCSGRPIISRCEPWKPPNRTDLID